MNPFCLNDLAFYVPLSFENDMHSMGYPQRDRTSPEDIPINELNL